MMQTATFWSVESVGVMGFSSAAPMLWGSRLCSASACFLDARSATSHVRLTPTPAVPFLSAFPLGSF